MNFNDNMLFRKYELNNLSKDCTISKNAELDDKEV